MGVADEIFDEVIPEWEAAKTAILRGRYEVALKHVGNIVGRLEWAIREQGEKA